MIESAHDTSALPVRLRRAIGSVSDDGMAIGMGAPASATGGAGPYRASATRQRPRTFRVVDVRETSAALIDAPASATVRGQITQALLQRHAVVVLLEAEASGGAVLTVSSRSLELPAAVMVAARATAALQVAGRGAARSLVFVVRAAGPRADAMPHHVSALATPHGPAWRVAAFRPEHEWPALRARFGAGAFVGVDVAGTRAFVARRGRVAGDRMLVDVEAALRDLAHRWGAVFVRGRGDEFLFATEVARGVALAEAALQAIDDLAVDDGAGGTVGARAAVVSGAPPETVTDRLDAAIRTAARHEGEGIRVELE